MYLADNMFNGLAVELSRMGIGCVTVNEQIWGDNKSETKGRYDPIIFRFLLQKKFELVPIESKENWTVITADKDLARYCKEFGLDCEFVDRKTAPSKSETKELSVMIASKVGKKD